MSQAVRRSKRLQAKREKSISAAFTQKETKRKTTNAKRKASKEKAHKIGDKKSTKAKQKSDTKKNNAQNMNYWLMKSEPSAYSIDDLMAEGDAGDYWDGIRNYQVRNMIRDQIKEGDQALFYHSCCKPPGIAGSMTVTKAAYPDFTAFDKKEKYYDAKSDPDNPRWFMFDVRFESKFKNFISLYQLKQCKELETMKILQKGNRLSITRITKQEYEFIMKLGHR